MTEERFHELIHVVIDRLGAAAPPHDLFAGGVADWHARARLAHFLAQAEEKETQEAALEHINLAIECAEGTDFLYKYILRGELWADRWNLMHKLHMTEDAEAEVDERIAAFDGLADAVPHNSYLYYGYRFKAHLAAERGVVLIAKDYMHMALHAMEIPPAYVQGLADAFAAAHENAPWILREIDRATPNPEQLHWDI